MRLNKKGFTLIELLGVLVVLAIILAITTPLIMGVIYNSKESAYNTQIEVLLDSAYHYSAENDLGIENNVLKKLEFQDIVDAGLLDKIPNNPLTDKTFEGCIIYKWDESIKQYTFEYSETCEVPSYVMVSGPVFNQMIQEHIKLIRIIDFHSTIKPEGYPDAIEVYDFSEAQNKSIMGYLVPEDTYYRLYIEKDGIIEANEDCSEMFLYNDFYTDINEIGINQIYFNGAFNTSNVKDMGYMFSTTYLNKVDFINLDVSSVTNMSHMFHVVEALSHIDLTGWDTSNVTNMNLMFSGYSIENIIFGNDFDTSNVTNMSQMFIITYRLNELDISFFDYSSIVDMSYMFQYSSLSTIDISSLDISKKDLMTGFFHEAKYLSTVYAKDQEMADFLNSIDEIDKIVAIPKP